jgi:hypothetical protein
MGGVHEIGGGSPTRIQAPTTTSKTIDGGSSTNFIDERDRWDSPSYQRRPRTPALEFLRKAVAFFAKENA